MENNRFDVESIKQLVSHFANSGLGSFDLRDGEFNLRLESDAAACAAKVSPVSTETTVQHDSTPQQIANEDKAPEQTAKPQSNATVIKSPVVGTFYRSPSPDKEPFVTEKQTVKKGDVLFIIESMKLMNEIQSEYDGVIGEFLVQDGQGVEYGQPIVTIE